MLLHRESRVSGTSLQASTPSSARSTAAARLALQHPDVPQGCSPGAGPAGTGLARSWQQQVAEPPMDAGPLPAHAVGAAATVSPGNVLGADDKEKKEHLPLCASHRLSCGCPGHTPKGVRILTMPQERQIPY